MINENLQKSILNLKANDKIALIEIIMQSLESSDEAVEQLWIKESEKRYEAYKAGKVPSRSYEEVMKMLEK